MSQSMWNGRMRGALVALAACGMLFSAAESKACADPTAGKPAPIRIPFQDQSEWRQDEGRPPIVGLWHTVYTQTSGLPFNETLKQWHSDGTENENANLPPIGGNVCFGVWKETGPRSVKLHHLGLMFNPPNPADPNCLVGCPLGNFTIDETDTVSKDGKTYTGMFTFKTFNTDGSPTGLVITGTVVATRITVND
jgi:hypothetical protein